jgi:pyruvate/2-oxoglutarate/acetoin dehydrogenase E1 component
MPRMMIVIFTFFLNFVAVGSVWNALSQHKSRVHYIQGRTLSESINYRHAIFSGVKFLGTHSQQLVADFTRHTVHKKRLHGASPR